MHVAARHTVRCHGPIPPPMGPTGCILGDKGEIGMQQCMGHAPMHSDRRQVGQTPQSGQRARHEPTTGAGARVWAVHFSGHSLWPLGPAKCSYFL